MRYPSGKTHLWAIIGDPVSHVRAPFFFNPLFEERGLDAFLFPLHVPAAAFYDGLVANLTVHVDCELPVSLSM